MTSNDLVGIIGGTLGLFLGFSFFGCISVMLDYVSLLVTKVTKSQVQESASGGKGNVRKLDSPDFEIYRTSGTGRDVRTSSIQESIMTWIVHFFCFFIATFVAYFINALYFMAYLFKFQEMVLCFQNCSELLWEKVVLVTKQNFWN